MSMSNRVRALFHKTKKLPELSESVITHDRLDDGVLDDMTERALHFRTRRYNAPTVDLEGMEDGEGNPVELTPEQIEKAESYVRWDNLFSDTFRALHTLDGPEVKSSDEIKPSCELNKRIMSQVISSDKFQSIRPETRHDEIASAFTAINLADSLEESLTGELREMVLRTQQMKDSEDEAESAQEQLDALRDAVRQQGGQATQEQKDAMKAAAQTKTQARKDMAQQQSQQQAQGMGTNVIDAIDQAVEDAADAADAISNLPGTEPGTGKKLTPDQMIELAEKWKENPSMREIAKMMGRMQRDLRYRRTNRIVGGREEIIDVKLGSDLPLLLPHEKVKLRHPLLRRDFMRRFYEDSLLQYETRGYAEAGRGPIIVCIDGSGSMGGMPNIWARAVALSFVTIAKREKRDSATVEFSSAGQQKRWDFFAKEPVNPMKVLDFASHMFNGGTDITGGLRLAMDMIRSVPEFKTADIVLATDGHDSYRDDDEELRKEALALGVRLHGVAIGMDAEANNYLQTMCETSVSAWDLAGSNDATDHLADMIS